MLCVNYLSGQRNFLELPKFCQQWELTFLLTVAFRATKFPTTLTVEVPVAFRATKNLEDIMPPANYESWQQSFSELTKFSQQSKMTFLLTITFELPKFS